MKPFSIVRRMIQSNLRYSTNQNSECNHENRNQISSFSRRMKRFISISVLIIAGIFLTIPDDTFHNEQRLLSVAESTSSSKERPIMYTFYGKNLDHERSPKYHLEQDEMVEEWKKNWNDAGWEPRILTDKDAKKHPKYEEYSKEINKLKIGHYDHLCFHRWLAMAQVGGYMSDFDLVPLSQFKLKEGHTVHDLPNDGKFTVYDPSIKDGAVPSLLSGSKEEWDKLAQGIMKYISSHEGEFLNDMRALVHYMIDHPHEVQIQQRVMPKVFYNRENTKLDCDKYHDGIYAMHFSHMAERKALEARLIKSNPKYRSRAGHIRDFLAAWKKECTNKDSPRYFTL